MHLGEDSTITIGLGIVVLSLVWGIAHKLARATARMDAADERQEVSKHELADHETRIRLLEQHRNPTQFRRRSTD